MKTKHFEKNIPDGYRQVFYINAKKAKVGIIFNLIALVVLALVIVVASIPINGIQSIFEGIEITEYAIAYLIFMAAMLLYIVLHELVHGISYKIMTKEKLTFGISWSCAFCGVPNIYVYRKCSVISAAAPLMVFTVLMLPLTVALYFVHPLYYMLSAFLLGLHLGGCCGDFYLICLLLFKYKDQKTLVKDTGPEQFIYVPQK